MNNYIKCSNGHLYSDNLGSCPHCPSSDKTKIINSNDMNGTYNTNKGSNIDLDKTQISGGGYVEGGNFDSTLIFGSHQTVNDASEKSKDLNRTYIKIEDESIDGVSGVENARPSRKITAWLISYTIDPMGVDFRIYEGSNSIGRDPENSISIPEDNSISGKHLTLLCKKDRFYLKDEMSANGTFINENEIEIGLPYELKDGDIIKLGSTILKFRSAL